MLSTSASSISYRQKGKLPSANSKLYKGFIHDATSKLSVGSIPAKMELIIYRDQSVKAFGSSEARFKRANGDVPGPQEYENSALFQFGKKNEESVSKKGLGGLAASQERQVFAQKYINTGPGPGSYVENQSFMTQSTQPSFFMKQKVPKLSEKQEIINPGPGEYEVPNQHLKSNVVKHVFESKTLRGNFQNKPNFPPPGSYNVQQQQSKPQHNGPTSSFYPDSSALKEPTAQQQIVQMLLSETDKPSEKYTPGPGEYEIKFPEFSPDYIQKKELSSFSKVNGKDRFGRATSQEKQEKDNYLGPGTYDHQTQFEKIVEEKNYVTNSVFMSEINRQPFGNYEQRLGPNSKIPYLLPKKKTFHLNLQRKWV